MRGAWRRGFACRAHKVCAHRQPVFTRASHCTACARAIIVISARQGLQSRAGTPCQVSGAAGFCAERPLHSAAHVLKPKRCASFATLYGPPPHDSLSPRVKPFLLSRLKKRRRSVVARVKQPLSISSTFRGVKKRRRKCIWYRCCKTLFCKMEKEGRLEEGLRLPPHPPSLFRSRDNSEGGSSHAPPHHTPPSDAACASAACPPVWRSTRTAVARVMPPPTRRA